MNKGQKKEGFVFFLMHFCYPRMKTVTKSRVEKRQKKVE